MFRGRKKIELLNALDIYAEAQTSVLLEGLPNNPDPVQEMAVESKDPFESAFVLVKPARYSRVSRKTLLIPLAALLVLLMSFVVSADTRQKTLEQLRNIGKGEVTYEFWDERDDQSVEIVLPELSIDIPEGFELVKEGGSPTGIHRRYVNEQTGDEIFFSYSSLNSSGFKGFSYVDGMQHIVINGMDADLYPHNESSSQCNIIWIDKSLDVCITIDTTLSEEFLIELAESLYK